MSKLRVKLQNIVFPEEKKIYSAVDLFFRGAPLAINRLGETTIPAGLRINFNTYINSLSLNKWKKLTYANSFKLMLIARGKFSIDKMAYKKGYTGIENIDLGTEEYELKEKTSIEISFKDVEATLLSFAINALSECTIYEAYYFAEVERKREVNIAIATTTYKREEYIIDNVKRLKEKILDISEDISKHVCVHVVDNGKTLDKKDIESEGVYLHQNINAGGAGGYTRGMIEVIKQNENAKDNNKITHIILMDDDVLIMPEAIKRTWYLLTILKPEYHRHFINGAMFRITEPRCQHENLGRCYTHRDFGNLRFYDDMSNIYCVMENENDERIQNFDNLYAAWWYCAIPMEYIRKDNLPLPLFVRGDDIEYSLRNNAKFISLNGIYIWHQSFKWVDYLKSYYEERNTLVLSTVNDRFKFIQREQSIEKKFREMLFKLNYKCAEMALDAFEDYISGPDFFINSNPEQKLQEIINKSEKLVPVDNNLLNRYNISLSWDNPMRTRLQKLIYKLTFNGILLPDFMLKKEPEIVYHGVLYTPKKYYLRKNLISVNPHSDMKVSRTMNRKLFFKLMKRYIELMRRYKKNVKNIEREYNEKFKYLTSYEFWENYLGSKKGD